MTYTNEEIEAKASQFDREGDPEVSFMLHAWLDERKKMVVTDEMVQLALNAPVEGGNAVRDYLPGRYTDELVQTITRAALEAALKEMQK